MALVDIMYESPHMVRRKATAAITAGQLVYKDGTNWQVAKTANSSCGGYAFDGVAMDSVAAASWLSVAVEPSEAYVNATGTLTAGQYVCPGHDGYCHNWSTSFKNSIICGRVIKGATTGKAALIKIMNVPNYSAVV